MTAVASRFSWEAKPALAGWATGGEVSLPAKARDCQGFAEFEERNCLICRTVLPKAVSPGDLLERLASIDEHSLPFAGLRRGIR